MDNLINRFGKTKVFWVSFGVLASLIVLMTIIMNLLYRTLPYNGTTLWLTGITETTVTMQDTQGAVLEMRAERISQSLRTNFTIEYKDKTMHYNSYAADSGSVFIFSDGVQFVEPHLIAYDSNGEPINLGLERLTQTQLSEKEFISAVLNIYWNKKLTHDYVYACLSAMPFLLLGVFIFINPHLLWNFQAMFFVQNGEPTDFAIFTNKSLGILLILLAFITPAVLR